MGDNNGSELPPSQAGFRFLLEMAALAGWGIAGWHLTDGGVRWIFVIVLPLAAAITWGTVRAPADHSANGKSPIPVPGVVRLGIELAILFGAALLTALVWRPWFGVALAGAVGLHYATTLGRVRWLLDQGSPR